ncbi:hypothetical protein ACYFX5_02135 [Bremerella sp. T1]|uniref:hypothetical protein n=1 Tax=Bremerella sp. TYQ1 TaxID=3119568 RepID=UPI001CCF933F|nr:hypothetical protein [Bremerella volcania]UBM37074.1 hypothetical protein LA756_04085 [Bremerella volcania]
MYWMIAALCLLVTLGVSESDSPPGPVVVVVVGEPGEPQYKELFQQWSSNWQEAAERAGKSFHLIGIDSVEVSDKPDVELLNDTLMKLQKKPPQELWLVLIGHGTFDGEKAKFNLRGPDIASTEISDLIGSISCRMAIVNCTSSSGPFLGELSGEQRVVVTATQSGFEYNFARFGGFLSEAIGQASGDLDKDGETSLLEAWIAASKQTSQYYESKSQLATEHSMLDDNGDGKGTPADWFRGVHLAKTSRDESLPDGTLANQFILVPGTEAERLSEDSVLERNKLEKQLADLRQRKGDFTEKEYLDRLETILIPLAKLYEPLRKEDSSPDSSQE